MPASLAAKNAGALKRHGFTGCEETPAGSMCAKGRDFSHANKIHKISRALAPAALLAMLSLTGSEDRLRMHCLLAYVNVKPTLRGASFTWEGAWEYDPVSRTLLVEIDIDNRSGELLPGSLAQVHFKAPATGTSFIVPSAALIFRREGMRVGTVVNGNIAHLIPVIIGEDDGATVQIVNGIGAGDRVIQDPPDSLIEGEKVYIEESGNPGATGGK